MAWRKWLVRCLVFSVAGSLAVSAVLYERLTSPEAVRRQVIDKLGAHLVGANITLQSAQLQILGGIYLHELRLTRRDDPHQNELAYVPSAVLYHDKEQLGHGKLIIRKIELHQPRLRVVRGADGRWNVANILGTPHPDQPIPTIVVQQGTLLVEDRLASPTLPAVEISPVDLTILNDPLETLNFAGKARAELASSLSVKGTWQRTVGDTSLSIAAGGVLVGPPLLKRMSAYWPDLFAQVQHLRGTGSMKADLAYRPSSASGWTHSVSWELSDGKFSHPKLPLPLDDLELSVRCLDGQVALDRLKARSGSAIVELQGSAQSCSMDTDLSGNLSVSRLQVTDTLFSHLPTGLHNLEKIHKDFNPRGPISLTVQFARRAGQWYRHCLVQAEDLAMTFVKFPYLLEHITGTLDQEIDPVRSIDVLRVDLVGAAGSQRVFIRGDITGEAPDPAVVMKIWATNVPLDQRLRSALLPKHQKLAAAFHPTGQADFEAYIQRKQGAHEFANRFVIRFHHATVRYDEFPYPLEEVSGLLDIQPDHFQFSDFRGTHKGGEIRTAGRSVRTAVGDQLDIQVSGDNVLIDPELEAALKPELKEAWKIFRPAGQGRMKFRAQVDRDPPEEPPQVDVTVTAEGCSIRPEFFPYALDNLQGTLHYAKHWVYVQNMRARHGRTVMTLDDGKIYVKPEGGIWADLHAIQASPLVPDADFLVSLPPGLRHVCEGLHLKDPVQLNTRLTIDSASGPGAAAVIYWDGNMSFADASLNAGIPIEHIRGQAACRGRYNGHELEGLVGNIAFSEATLFKQPFHDIQSEMEVRKDSPNVFALKGVHAKLFGGEVYGPVRLEFGGAARYEINLTASQVRLEELGRHNIGAGAQWSGQAEARLHLTGRGADVSELEGQGTIDVPNGKLYNLPLMLDLLKFLGLRLPDGTAFDEAHVAFAIHGPRVGVSRLDLFGNSISLRGQGEMNLDGSDINLDFYAVWARIIQYLPPFIKEIPPYISQNLLKIKMHGRIDDIHFTKEPVPVLIEPMKELLERLGGRKSGP